MAAVELDDWRDGAVCAGTDPAVFFQNAGPGRPPNYSAAKKLCARCEVRGECLAEALDAERGSSLDYRHGFVGGTTPAQRKAMDVREERACVVCSRTFMPVNNEHKCCTARCREVWNAGYNREWQRTYRNNGLPNPLANHGSITQAQTGCTCVACKGRRRNLRREQRVIAGPDLRTKAYRA